MKKETAIERNPIQKHITDIRTNRQRQRRKLADWKKEDRYEKKWRK